MKIKYSIEKYKLDRHNYVYRLYKNVINHGIGSRKLFEGTYTECKKYLKTIKEQ